MVVSFDDELNWSADCSLVRSSFLVFLASLACLLNFDLIIIAVQFITPSI